MERPEISMTTGPAARKANTIAGSQILKRLPIKVIELKDQENSEAEIRKIATEIKRFARQV